MIQTASVTAIVPSTVCQRIEAAVIYLSILQIIFHFQSRHFATRCWGLRQKVQGLKWNKCLLVAGLHNIKHHTPTPRCDWLWVCINLHIYTDTSSVSAFVGFLSCLVLLKINNVHECEWHSEIPNAWDTSARDTRVFNMGCKISQIIPEMLSLCIKLNTSSRLLTAQGDNQLSIKVWSNHTRFSATKSIQTFFGFFIKT